MALITNIETLRKHVKISATSTEPVVLPDFTMVEWKYLVPVLGQALYDELNTNVSSPAWANLLQFSRGVIAPMAVYHDLAFLQATITDTGIKTMSSDTMQAAPKWVYREIREALLEKAAFATERLIEYVIAPGAGAPFTYSNEAIKNNLFKTGKQFAAYHFIYHPYRTFIQLLPVIREVEDHYIRTTIGGDFYDAFLIATLTNQHEKNLSDLLQKAVANLTISKAIESLPVKITAHGFTVKMADGVDDPYTEQQATDRQLELTRSSTLETGTRYLLQLKAFLDAKASTELFTDYFNSSYYISPAAPKKDPVEEDDNAYRNGVFAL